MNLSDEARRILENGGYRVYSRNPATLQFEDDTLLGFVAICASGEEIVRVWRDQQAFFLRENAAALRESGLKAWNVYSVFLAEFSGYSETKRELLSVEEDFQSTRKIAQSNLLSVADVVRSLLPLLPIQNLTTPRQEDPLSRLRARVGDKVFRAIQNVKSPDELASIFLNLP